MVKRKNHPRDAALLALSIVLLVGAGMDRLSMSPSADATAYHARVREEAALAPLSFGPWIGKDCPEPAEAIDLLKPNTIISRIFWDETGHRQATFLLVQCADVRDMISHFPPICYPNRGLTLAVKPTLLDWVTNGLEIHATEYQFESTTFQSSELTIVDNFMVLPSGKIVADMDDVKKRLKLNVRYFGVAQVQIVFDGGTPPDQRRQICNELIEAHRPIIDVIRSGVR